MLNIYVCIFISYLLGKRSTSIVYRTQLTSDCSTFIVHNDN